MKSEFYPSIYKRKSFHTFKNVEKEKISHQELETIYSIYSTFESLFDIQTKIRIVSGNQIEKSRDGQYCILFYSELKENYLQNIGYLGQQMDFYLTSHNIGTLWYGIGKPDIEQIDSLHFVIMMIFSKIKDSVHFRKDMFKSKRKPLNEIWKGKQIEGVSGIIRYACSACNLQPWFVHRKEDRLYVYRIFDCNRRGIMPKNKVIFYNKIDIGIFLCFLNLCLVHEKIPYEMEFQSDTEEQEKNLYAIYKIKTSS